MTVTITITKDDLTVPKLGAYAFWPYDLFPYLLGGKIGNNPATGTFAYRNTVYITSYGHYFTPKFCLELRAGGELIAILDQLREHNRVLLNNAKVQVNQLRRNSPLGWLDPRR